MPSLSYGPLPSLPETPRTPPVSDQLGRLIPPTPTLVRGMDHLTQRDTLGLHHDFAIPRQPRHRGDENRAQSNRFREMQCRATRLQSRDPGSLSRDERRFLREFRPYHMNSLPVAVPAEEPHSPFHNSGWNDFTPVRRIADSTLEASARAAHSSNAINNLSPTEFIVYPATLQCSYANG